MKERTKLSQIFDVFSRRDKGLHYIDKPLTAEFRHRALQLCTDIFTGYFSTLSMSSTPKITIFWTTIQQNLRYLHGRPHLTGRAVKADQDAVNFLLDCTDEHFFDFIEIIFKSEKLWELIAVVQMQDLIKGIKRIF